MLKKNKLFAFLFVYLLSYKTNFIKGLTLLHSERAKIVYNFGLSECKRVVVALLFYVHGKHLRSCRDGQLT